MKRLFVTATQSKVFKTILFVWLLGMASFALADSDRLRRSNEARHLDLKMQQQQILRQQPAFSDRQRLEKRFERQQTQQNILQSQQRRRLYAPRPVPTKPNVDTSARKGTLERFEREQRSQALGFKMERSQQTKPGIDIHQEEEDLPAFQWPFKEK